MDKIKIDDKTASKIRVPKGKRDVRVWDSELNGFFVRKQATGAAAYGCRFWISGKPKEITIAPVVEDVKGCAAARAEALRIVSKANLGQDIVAEKKAATEAAKRQKVTLWDVAEKYLKARKKELRRRSYLEVERAIGTHWKPLHKEPIDTITRTQVVKVIDDLAESSGKVAADRARTALSTLYVWAIDKSYVTGTPVLHIKRRAGKVSRDRTLSEAELIEVCAAADTIKNTDYGRIIKLLILTAQRKSEIGGLDWSEIDEANVRIDLLGARTKNGLPHIVPLSAQALALLPARRDKTTKLFGRPHGLGYSGWSRAKERIDEAILEAREKANQKAKPMPGWTVHDLRRTTITMLGELGFAPPHVCESITNHVSGVKADVAGVYNKALYWKERVEALNAWGAYVHGITAAKPALVKGAA